MKTPFSRLAIAIGIVSAPWVIAPGAQQAPGPAQETFRAAVDIVTIQASVRDARGHVMSGLKTTDFEVRDNGQLRPLLSLRSDRQSPLSVAMLVDMSGSMRIGAKIAMARQAYESVLSQLHRANDEVARTSGLHAGCLQTSRGVVRFRALRHDVAV
ncbi:MAG: hypothetical protein DMF92_13170 [Acidobacteria bacterium]|nr:MAG: hypothetical protein DMF92_13170 [Acidobacteriota bacterium]